jgi:ABC-type amino acid transport system permease subunit
MRLEVFKKLLHNILRLKTPLILLLFWFAYWGLRDGISTLSFPIGFFALSLILAHIIAKEIFRNYNWDVGQRLNEAWDKESKPHAILASSMLIVRVAIYAIVIIALALLTNMFFGRT